MLRTALLVSSRKRMPVRRLAHNEEAWKKNNKRPLPVEKAYEGGKPYIFFTAEEGREFEKDAARIAENVWRYGTTSIGMPTVLSTEPSEKVSKFSENDTSTTEPH